ncbi:MAG: metallophosphoesterase family protein [Thermoleophilaceae bacterium]
MALVWLVLFLVAAAPANAASVGLAPASGVGGTKPTLVATDLTPRSLVGVKVGRRAVELLRADGAGNLTTQPRMPRRRQGRVRIAVAEQRGGAAILHYRVRSPWSPLVRTATANLGGPVLNVDTDLRAGRLIAFANVSGLEPGTEVAAEFAGKRVGEDVAGRGGLAEIRAELEPTAAGYAIVIRGRGVRLAASLPTPPASVVFAGDIACKPPYETYEDHCQHGEVAELIAELGPDVVGIPGDIQYDGGRMSEFEGSFDPTWGQLEMPLRPTPGNHEYRVPGAEDFFDYFELQSGGWRPPNWYGYNVGPWRLISMNSNCEESRVDCSDNSEQEQWLRANLAAEPFRCTLAYWHHPRYSSGFHGSDPRTARLWRILDRAQAELVITGHDHHYERFAPQDENGQRTDAGLREFIVGTGGSALSVVREPVAPHSEYAQNRTFGVLHLRLYASSYRWRFIALNGTVLDRGLGGCL